MSVVGLEVRAACAGDAGVLCALSVRAILQSASAHYDQAQLGAWAARRSVESHARTIEETSTFVAVDGQDVAGFVSVALNAGGALLPGE